MSQLLRVKVLGQTSLYPDSLYSGKKLPLRCRSDRGGSTRGNLPSTPLYICRISIWSLFLSPPQYLLRGKQKYHFAPLPQYSKLIVGKKIRSPPMTNTDLHPW